MSFLDRLRSARYRSPSGAEFEFLFSELSRAGGKKAATHELPQQDYAEVQDLGNTATRFPLSIFFQGADYDRTADAFYAALEERGPGILLHPRWGDLNVQPLTFLQKEQFVDHARVATFEIEFIRVITPTYPFSAAQLEEQIGSKMDDLEDTQVAAFADNFSPESAADLIKTKDDLVGSAQTLHDKIAGVIAAAGETATDFEQQFNDFIRDVDELAQDAPALGEAFINLVRTPARVAVGIWQKIIGFGACLQTLISEIVPTTSTQAASKTMQVAAVGSALAESCLAGTVNTRAEAVAIAETIKQALADGLVSIEDSESSVDGYDAARDVLSQLKAILDDASALMLERSFSLRIERRIVLQSERTPLDLVYDFYGEIDSLDDFIEQNHLRGEELFLIPRGREVAYYA